MKVAVLGSGVVGVATAWWLKQDGHEVVVVDRHTGPAREASRAPGGLLSAAYGEPWATRDAPQQLLKSLFDDNAPIGFRLRASRGQWVWAAQYLRECWPGRLEHNVRPLVQLSAYSLALLRQLRSQLGIDDAAQQGGILNIYRNAADLERSQNLAQVLRNLGVDRRIVGVDEMLELEPALAPVRRRLVGGDFTANDGSGDAWRFTTALADHAQQAGVQFLYSQLVTRLVAHEGRIAGAELLGPDGLYHMLQADAFVVALGAYTPCLLGPLGIPCHVWPVKGYSLNFPLIEPDRAPKISLTDYSHKVVYSRLGDQLRMSGRVRLDGYSRALDPACKAAMVAQARQLLPSVLDFENASFWSGLRPSTPSGIPLVGRSRIANLFLNTGHGSSGWTLAAGSGRALADIVSGRIPEPEFPFLG